MRLVVRLSLVVVACAAAVFAPLSASAQSNSPDLTIRGVVLDSTHAAIVGARVEASSAAQPQPESTITDAAGTFVLYVKAGQELV